MEQFKSMSITTKVLLIVLLIALLCGVGALGIFIFGLIGGGATPTATPGAGIPGDDTGDIPIVIITPAPGATIVLPTAAPGVPSLTANTNVNVRSGPGTHYHRIGLMVQGQTAEVIGRSPDGAWWVIKFPGVSSGQGWVSAAYVTTTGTENVPIIQPPVAPAPTPTPPVPISGWKGEYWNNTNLQGQPNLVRDDSELNFNWGNTSPDPKINAENFSARWTIARNVPAGTYRLSLWVDDGARVWVNDTLVIDEWREGSARNIVVDVNVPVGNNSVKMEYFNGKIGAVAILDVTYLQEFPNWKTEYFNNTDLKGEPVVVRNEVEINQNWGANSPAQGVPSDNYSVRWSQRPFFEEGYYVFKAYVQGGVRLWVDGNLLLDEWQMQGPVELPTIPFYLSRGGHDMRIDYFKNTGNGQIKVWWEKQEPVQGPDAVINGPGEVQVGQNAHFDANSSSVATGNHLVSFDWDFGDGATASGPVVDHVYNSAGEYAVKLVIVDDKGNNGQAGQKITVSKAPMPDQPPVASINAPDQAEVGQTVTFDASGSSWTNDITSFAWSFGDGTNADAIQIDKVYNAAGVYNVTLTLTDNKGLQGTTNKQITIVQPAATATPPPAATDTATPPPAATDTPQPGNPPTAKMSIAPNPQDVGQTVTFDGSASTGDNAAITGYNWDFGDGQTTSGASVNHVYNAAGQYNVQLTVTDENGQQGVARDVVTINDIVAPTPTTDPQVDELESQMWTLADAISGTLITAEFQNGQLSGSGGCNTYNATYDVSGGNGSISITLNGGTNMLCGNAIDAQETQFLTALQAASNFQVQGNQMTLMGPTTLNFVGIHR